MGDFCTFAFLITALVGISALDLIGYHFNE